MSSSAARSGASAQRYWPCVQRPRGRPRTIRPSAASSGRMRDRRADLRLPARPGAEADLRREQRIGAGEVRGECLIAFAQRVERGGGYPVDPAGGVVREAALRDELLEPRPLARRDGSRARGVDDRREVERHDPERPAHPEHPHERALVVERLLEPGRLEVVRPGPGREEHRRGIGRVERDERRCRFDGIRGACLRREAVAEDEAGPPLGRVDPSHSTVLPPAPATSPVACVSGPGSTPFRGTDGVCGSATFPFVSSGATSVSGMARRRRSRRIAVRRAVLLVGFVALLAFVTLTLLAGSPTRLPAGTTVGGLDVGGMGLAEATHELEARSDALAHTSVQFVAGGRTFTATASQLGVRADWEDAVRAAANAGDGVAPIRGLKRIQSRLFGSDVEPHVDVYPSAVRYTVARIAAAVDRPAVDASLERKGLAIVTTDARPGVRLDRSRASAALVDALASTRPARPGAPARRARRAEGHGGAARRCGRGGPNRGLGTGHADRRPDAVPARPVADRAAPGPAERRRDQRRHRRDGGSRRGSRPSAAR